MTTSRAAQAAGREDPMHGFQCRWGEPGTAACWDVGACGCMPTSVEEAWREAHGEQAARLARSIFDALADALRLPQFVAWLGRKVARP